MREGLAAFSLSAAAILMLVVLVAFNAPTPTVAGAVSGAVTTPSTITELGTLDAGKVQDFVVQVDNALDRLEEPVTSPSDYDAMMWAFEILPYFEYEQVRNRPVVPDAIQMTPYLTGMEHNHILGRAHCVSGEDMPSASADRPYPFVVELNMRMMNEHSSWLSDPSYLSTLTHELAHIQGACGHGATDEHTAQVVTVEILSALVLGGNREALYPLLEEIRGWGMSYLLYDAINLNDGSEEKLAAHQEFRDRIYDDAFQTARSEKSLRFWDTQGRKELATILHTYSVTPLVKLFEGFESGTVNLVIPEFKDYVRGIEIDRYRGYRDFSVDDFVALIESLEELVDQAEIEQDAARERDQA